MAPALKSRLKGKKIGDRSSRICAKDLNHHLSKKVMKNPGKKNMGVCEIVTFSFIGIFQPMISSKNPLEKKKKEREKAPLLWEALRKEDVERCQSTLQSTESQIEVRVQGSGRRWGQTACMVADLSQGSPPELSLRNTEEDSLHEGFAYKTRESHPQATPSSPRRKKLKLI